MYSYKNRVYFSQVGEDHRMTITDMVDVMQDCSCVHSDSLGLGREYLENKERAWLLHSWQILFDRYPREGEEYIVETRPWKFEGFFGQRNFALMDGEGKYLAKANSIWFFINTARMRPVRPDPEDIAAYGVDEPLEMEYAGRKKLSIPEHMEEQESFPVRRCHLDANHHVNNAQYIQMAEEYFPADREVAQLWVEYRMAAKYGDRIRPAVGTDEEGRITVTLSREDGEVCVVLKAALRE